MAAYIILGLATIGSEIENPFGQDVNDLPLDTYCRQIALELDIITATPPPKVEDFMSRPDNLVLFPLSQSGYDEWKDRSAEDIRAALRTKVVANPAATVIPAKTVNPAAAPSNASTVVVDTKTKQSV